MQIKFEKKDIELLEETLSEGINNTLGDIFSDGYITEVVLDTFEKSMAGEIGKQISISVENYIKENIGEIIKKEIEKKVNEKMKDL